MTRTKFMAKLCKALSNVGIECSKYSKRTVSELVAAAKGIQDFLI